MLGLSGGVDSSVAALMLHKAIGDRLHCIFVDNGLLRKDEPESVESTFGDHFHMDLTTSSTPASASSRSLAGVTDPEQKRKIIGHDFVEVFRAEATALRERGTSWARARSTPT